MFGGVFREHIISREHTISSMDGERGLKGAAKNRLRITLKDQPGKDTTFLIPELKCCSWDFPGGPVAKNLPYNAGDSGSIRGWGTKIPHATGQLSPRAATTEPMLLN